MNEHKKEKNLRPLAILQKIQLFGVSDWIPR